MNTNLVTKCGRLGTCEKCSEFKLQVGKINGFVCALPADSIRFLYIQAEREAERERSIEYKPVTTRHRRPALP